MRAVDFSFDEVIDDLKQMIFDLNHELEHLLFPITPRQPWSSADQVNLHATNLFEAADRAYRVVSGEHWDGDIFEESWLADLDRFYQIHGSPVGNWSPVSVGRVVGRLIDAVITINDFYLGNDIDLRRAADYLGVAEKTLRNALASGELKYGAEKGFIESASFRAWIKHKPRYRIPIADRVRVPLSQDVAGERPTRENLEALFVSLRLTPHPKDLQKNMYMHAYQTGRGVTLAHEHARKTQHLWIQSTDLPDFDVLDRFVAKRYPATSLDAAPYGRHSGLRKYPELSEAELIRVSPRTVAEAWQIITQIAPELAGNPSSD